MLHDNSVLMDLVLICTYLSILNRKIPLHFPVSSEARLTFFPCSTPALRGEGLALFLPLFTFKTRFELRSRRWEKRCSSRGNVARWSFLKETRLSGTRDTLLQWLPPLDSSIQATNPPYPTLRPSNGSVLSQFTENRPPPIRWIQGILYSSLSYALLALCLETERVWRERGAKREESEC